MKFSDGYWMNKKQYRIAYANQAYETSYESDKIKILAANTHIYGRGQTLGGPVFDVTFTSPRPNVIGVEVIHYKGVWTDIQFGDFKGAFDNDSIIPMRANNC